MDRADEELVALLQPALEAVLEFTGATVGWIGLVEPDGRLSFPAQRGSFSRSWLTLQQGKASVWGFGVRDEPTLLNELPTWPMLGEPPLRNLLSCPLLRDQRPSSHIILANKPNGFTSHDATALQTTAHLLGKHLIAYRGSPRRRVPASLMRLSLDSAKEGILVVDHTGTLIFANATWARWTGYPVEELCNLPAPFPFWVSHRDLAGLGGPAPVLPKAFAAAAGSLGLAPTETARRIGYLPFQHRNHSLFWCQVEILTEEFAGREVTIAFLRRLPMGPLDVGEGPGSAVSFHSLAARLPFAVALTDRHGQVLWANAVFYEQIAPATEVLGQPLRNRFAPVSAAALERLIQDANMLEGDHRGHLLLHRLDPSGAVHKLATFWHTAPLPEGLGFVFALAQDWEGIWSAGLPAVPSPGIAGRSEIDWLVLLLRLGGGVEFWDERWERLTKLTQQDLAGVSSELVLDWLFPQEKERNFVADLLHHPQRRGTQAVLEVAGQNGRRSLLCTFLPVPSPAEDTWLILACEPQAALAENTNVQRFLRQFTRGLSHLLNNYLTVPIGLAEMALDRDDLPADVASWFSQILESCMRAGRLIASLQELSAMAPGATQRITLASLVQEVLEEQAADKAEKNYQLTVAVTGPDALVDVNPRMLKVVLRHLLTNAAQALLDPDRRRIDVRVYAGEREVCCEIHDTGEGLATEDWPAVFAPFYSTKGPFARESAHAELDAMGLGLTVSQHLLALHGGRLELRSTRGEGTTALLILPRQAGVPSQSSLPGVQREPVRADAVAEIAGPHPKQSSEVANQAERGS